MTLKGRHSKQFFIGAGRVFAQQLNTVNIFIAFGGYSNLNTGVFNNQSTVYPFDVRIKKITYTQIFNANAFPHDFFLVTGTGFPVIIVGSSIVLTGVDQNVIIDDLDVLVPANTGLAFVIHNTLPLASGLQSGTCGVLLERDS